MKFSKYAQRFLKDSGTVQLMADLGAADANSIMLGGGNPAHIPVVQRAFREALQQVMDEPNELERMLGDYSGPGGQNEFIELLAEFFRHSLGWNITHKNIALSNGSQASFSLLFNSFAGASLAGSERKILLPLVPEYIGYNDQQVGTTSILEAQLPSIEKHSTDFFKYRIDFDKLQLRQHHGAICLSRPTNPTGNVVTDDELQRLLSMAKRAHIPLIIDGAYGLPFPAMVYRAVNPLWDEQIILCLSLSKLGLPGVRTGIIIAKEEIIDMVSRANAINNLAPGNVGPHLLCKLLKEQRLLAMCQQHIQPFYQAKRQFAIGCLKEKMRNLPVVIHEPEGAFFLWLWIQGLPISSQALYRRLRKQNVFILAGEHFYPGIEGHRDWPHRYECIRLSYANSEHVIEQGITVIADTLRKLY